MYMVDPNPILAYPTRTIFHNWFALGVVLGQVGLALRQGGFVLGQGGFALGLPGFLYTNIYSQTGVTVCWHQDGALKILDK